MISDASGSYTYILHYDLKVQYKTMVKLHKKPLLLRQAGFFNNKQKWKIIKDFFKYNSIKNKLYVFLYLVVDY